MQGEGGGGGGFHLLSYNTKTEDTGCEFLASSCLGSPGALVNMAIHGTFWPFELAFKRFMNACKLSIVR